MNETGSAIKSNTGNGSAVTITADSTFIHTTGRHAPAIFAQSIGGGGGLVNHSGGFQQAGTAGGVGSGGTVTVSLAGTRVFAEGAGSAGIFAQSEGTSSGSIRIAIDSASEVRGGKPCECGVQEFDTRDAAAIRLLGGTGNQINNAGLISAITDPTLPPYYTAFAILADTTPGNIVVTNTGTIGTTTLTGNLVQSATGVLRIDMNARTGQADLLQVSGAATLDGTVAVNSVGVRRGTSGPVLTAAGGITSTPLLQALSTPVFSQSAVVTGNSLAIATNADFRSNDPAATASQRSAAGYLQRIWDRSDPAFDQGFETLATLKTQSSYVQALDSLSGKEVAAVASARFEAGQNFAREAFGCSTSTDNTTIRLGSHCVWARTVGVVIDNGASKDFPAYKWQAGSVKVGGQAEIRPNLEVAGSLGYENGRLNASGGNVHASSDTGLALAGLRYRTGPWTFDGVLDFAFGGLTTKRTIPEAGFARVSGTSNVFSTGLHLRAAYTVPLGAIYVEPALEFDARYVQIGGYTESGATPFNLKVNALQDVVLAATPGARIGSKFQLGPDTSANIYAGAGVSFINGNNFEVDARFASVSSAAGGFRSTFSNDSVVGRFTAGADIQTVAGISLSLQYQGRRSSHQTEHGGQARLAYRF